MDSLTMLQRHNSPITFHDSPNGFPSFLRMATLGNMECCYFEEHYRYAPIGNTKNCAFELATLRIPQGFRLRTYTVESNGSVILPIPTDNPVGKAFKKPLLLDLAEEGAIVEQKHYCGKNTLCAGNNGCPRAGTISGRFILFSYAVETLTGHVTSYYFMFIFPTQEIVFHVVPESDILSVIKIWDEKLKSATSNGKLLVLKLDEDIKYDDDLEFFKTQGPLNIPVQAEV